MTQSRSPASDIGDKLWWVTPENSGEPRRIDIDDHVPHVIEEALVSHPRIVVGSDGSAGSRAAVVWAAAQARGTGARVSLVHALSPWLALAFSVPPLDSHELKEAAAAELDGNWSEPLRSLGVEFDTKLGEDNPAQLLLDTARRMNADLLVVGRHGTGRWAPHVLGSVPRKLAQSSHCPLVVVPPDWSGPEPKAGPVVVGVDGSSASIAALDWGIHHATELGLSVRAVTAVHVPELAQAPWLAGFETAMGRKQAVLGLTAIVAGKSEETTVAVEAVVTSGHRNRVLENEAEDAAIIAVGSRGHGATASFLGGSVSAYLATHAECPVVICPDRP